MTFKNRFIRLATAVAIAGVVAAQIPSRSSVSMAADGYKGFLGMTGSGEVIAGTVAAGIAYGAVTAGASAAGTGSIIAAVGNSEPTIYARLAADNRFSHIRAMIDTAGMSEEYLNEIAKTVFFPSNEALEQMFMDNKDPKGWERIIGK